jgi:hypothetical protein
LVIETCIHLGSKLEEEREKERKRENIYSCLELFLITQVISRTEIEHATRFRAVKQERQVPIFPIRVISSFGNFPFLDNSDIQTSPTLWTSLIMPNGDKVLFASTLFSRDFLQYCKFCYAMSVGDPGCTYQIILVERCTCYLVRTNLTRCGRLGEGRGDGGRRKARGCERLSLAQSFRGCLPQLRSQVTHKLRSSTLDLPRTSPHQSPLVVPLYPLRVLGCCSGSSHAPLIGVPVVHGEDWWRLGGGKTG